MVDLSAFDRMRSFSDYRKLEDEFQRRKQQQGLQNQQAQLGMDLTRLQIEKAKQPQFDIETMAQKAAYKANLGLELTPEEQAAGRTYVMMNPSKTQYQPDLEGNVRAITQPNPLSGLFGGQQISSSVPQMATPPFSPAPMQPDLDAQLNALGQAPVAPAMMPPAPQGMPPLPQSSLQSPLMRAEAVKQMSKAYDPKFQAEQQELQRKQEMQKQSQISTTDIVTDDINRAISLIGGGSDPLPAAGTGTDIIGFVKESDAGKLRSLLPTIKANVGFEKLNQMRRESPTGGALGNVTEKELDFLQSVKGNLTADQDAQELDYNLKRVYNEMMDLTHGTPDQIMAIAQQQGMPRQQVESLMFRYPVQRQAPAGNQIPVINPQTGESFLIDEADFNDAKKDGFMRVK